MPSALKEIVRDDIRLQELNSELGNAVTLKSLVLTGFKMGLVMAVLIIEEVLTERAGSMADWPVCPICGRLLESKGWLPRTVTAIIGVITWKRKVWRCPKGCRTGQVAPFDVELGLRPNQRTGDEVRQTACVLAVFLPFNMASSFLMTLFCMEVSPTAIWNWVQCAGEEAMARLEKELGDLRNGLLPTAEETEAAIARLPLIIGGDGVMVPFRPDGGKPEGKTVWREVKVGIFARLGSRITRKGREVSVLVRKRVVAVLGNIEAFKSRMWLTSLKEGILQTGIVVWLSDGGRGFWGVFRDLFADRAQGVLDFYHAAQNLWKGARSRFDGRTTRARKWFASARQLLRLGKTKEILGEMRDALNSEDIPNSVKKTLKNVVFYLESHIDHISYDRYKELGLPIGSGMVESACKWLIQQRFKCVGMRWSERGFNHLLHLRLAWVNGTFDELFEPFYSPKS